jgi:hypothetical protein
MNILLRQFHAKLVVDAADQPLSVVVDLNKLKTGWSSFRKMTSGDQSA